MISILLDIAIGLGVAAVVCAAIDALISAAKLAKNRRARVRQDNGSGRVIIIAALVTLAAFASILVLSLTTP